MWHDRLAQVTCERVTNGKTSFATLNISSLKICLYKEQVPVGKKKKNQPDFISCIFLYQRAKHITSIQVKTYGYILHCRNTGSESANKSSSHGSTQGRSKHIATFSGKVRQPWFTIYPKVAAWQCQSFVPLSNMESKIYKSHGFHN